MTNIVTFPGLGLEFHLDRVAFSLFGHPVYWYGVIIGCGFLLAVLLCCRWAPRFGVNSDQIMDLLIFAVPSPWWGWWVYYVLFYLDLYRGTVPELGAIFRITDGGLAIYGGIIAAALTLIVFCRIRKISFFSLCRPGGPRFSDRPQCIGRWGNFMNVEAYGGVTGLPGGCVRESIATPCRPRTGGRGRLSGHPDSTLGCTLRFSFNLRIFCGHLSDLLDRKALEEI